jgi:hypothetical protein
MYANSTLLARASGSIGMDLILAARGGGSDIIYKSIYYLLMVKIINAQAWPETIR